MRSSGRKLWPMNTERDSNRHMAPTALCRIPGGMGARLARLRGRSKADTCLIWTEYGRVNTCYY